MQTTSSVYQAILQEENYHFEVKLNIAGSDYGEDVIFSMKSDSRLFESSPTIGGTYSGTLEFSLLGDGADIPRMAVVKPYYRAVGASQTSEWLQKGEYYIDTRSVSQNEGGIVVFNAFCYDAMLKANAPYASSTLSWPATPKQVVNEIAGKMGVTITSYASTVLNVSYISIPMPVQYNMREVLGFIAAAYGGNWFINYEGQLDFKELYMMGLGSAQLAVGTNVSSLNVSPNRGAYTKVILDVDDETAYESGTDETNVLDATCPYATQAVADRVLSELTQYSFLYKPFEVIGCWTNPAVELTDSITFTDTSVLRPVCARTINFGPAMVMDLSAPNDNDIDHEYAFESPTERNYKRTTEKVINQLNVNEEGISLVSQKLNNIGGRNLIINTLEPSVATLDQLPRLLEQPVATQPNTGISRVVLLPHGFKATKGTSAYRPSIQFNNSSQSSLCGLEAGETYTFSAKCVWKVSTAHPLRLIMAPYVNGTIVPSDERPKIFWDPTTVGAEEEKYVVFTFTVPDGATNIILQYNQPDASNSDYAETDYLGLDMIKLERGTVATAWTPAPEDMVGNNEIISKINISPENITISANKVDLQGYVTFTNLSTAGQTTINGANITTGTLNANAIAANSTFTQNLTATNFNITGGSISITTDSARSDVINLSYQNFNSYMSPYGVSGQDGTGSFSLSSTGRLTLKDPDGGGALYVYDKAQSNTAVTANAGNTSCGIQVGSYDNSVRGYLQYSSTATNKISLVIEDGRMWLDKSALEFRNSSGYATAKYTAEGDIQALSNGTLRMSLYSDEGLTFFNSSGNVTASYPATGWPTTDSGIVSQPTNATWTDTGRSYTVQKAGWYLIRGGLGYNNNQTRGVMLAFTLPSASYIYPFAVTENPNNTIASETGKAVPVLFTTAAMYIGDVGAVIRLYAKSSSSGQNNNTFITVHGPIA